MRTLIFGTALGDFGIGWTEKGIARVLLPGSDAAETRAKLNAYGPEDDPPRSIEAIVNRIEDYAAGERVEFADTPVDLSGVPDFHRRAYVILRRLAWGQTTTYGDIARELGDITLSRAVGQAMSANPLPLILLCHRVLASNGKPGGFSAPGGSLAKLKMLSLEGVSVGAPPGQLTLGF